MNIGNLTFETQVGEYIQHYGSALINDRRK